MAGMGSGSLLSCAWGSQLAPKGSQGVWVGWEREEGAPTRGKTRSSLVQHPPCRSVSSSAQQQRLAKEVTVHPAFPSPFQRQEGSTRPPSSALGGQRPPPSKKTSLHWTPGEGATYTWEEKRHAPRSFAVRMKCIRSPLEGEGSHSRVQPREQRQKCHGCTPACKWKPGSFLSESCPVALRECTCSRQAAAAVWKNQQPVSPPAFVPLSELRAPRVRRAQGCSRFRRDRV